MNTVYKTVKWYISMICLIIGIYCLSFSASSGDMRPAFIVVIAFGIVFLFSKSSYEASKKIFATGILVLIAAGIVAKGMDIFILPFYAPTIGFHMAWGMLTGLIGIPVMGWSF